MAAIIDSIVVVPIMLLEDFIRSEVNSKTGLAICSLVITALIFLYSVIMHYIYGQTLGKMFARVKVIDVGEQRGLTIGQAFVRDIVYLFFQVGAILYFFVGVSNTNISMTELSDKYDSLLFIIGLVCIAIELLTMLTNKRGRAFHDLIAKTVVVRIDTDKK